MEINNKRKRIIIFGVILFIIICTILIGFAIYKSTQNPYGKEVHISNIDQYTKGQLVDANTFSYIEHALYRTISYNVRKSVENNSIKDILIRDKTFSQTYDQTTHVYTVHFIVDIKSLKQSYRVSYQWVTDPQYGPNKDEYGTQVNCLAPIDLIYGSFNCKDDNTMRTGSANYDVVALLLPYHVYGQFTVKSYTKNSSITTLNVDAYASANENTVSQSELDQDTTEINSWLQSNKLNPNNYIINYIY